MRALSLNQVAEKIGSVFFQIEANTAAQRLLEYFFDQSKDMPELQRIELAKKLAQQWQLSKLPESWLPAVFSRCDWWYLIQLFSQQLHVTESGLPIHVDLSESYELLADYTTNFSKGLVSPLWQLIWQISDQTQIQGSHLPTRKQIDLVLKQTSQQVIAKLGLPDEYILRHIHFDELIRLASDLKIGQSKHYVHIEGYRRRLDGTLDGLMAGNHEFGGAQFIDSWWQDRTLADVSPCLVISKRL